MAYDDEFAAKLAGLIQAAYVPYPKDDPDAVLFTISHPIARQFYAAELAYLRGDFDYIIKIYRQFADDKPAQLAVAPTVILGAISLGDGATHREIAKTLRTIIESDAPPQVKTYAEFSLAVGNLGAHLAFKIPKWVVSGDFSNVYPGARLSACALRAKYFEVIGDYPVMLTTAQTALAMLPYDNTHQSSGTEITLLMQCAIAQNHLGQSQAAAESCLAAIDLALPHRFITPIAEVAVKVSGPLDGLVRKQYPEFFEALVAQSGCLTHNWLTFKNRERQSHMARQLSARDLQIAYHAACGESTAAIAKKFALAPTTVNNRLSYICDKLHITDSSPRKALAAWML